MYAGATQSNLLPLLPFLSFFFYSQLSFSPPFETIYKGFRSFAIKLDKRIKWKLIEDRKKEDKKQDKHYAKFNINKC